MTITSPQRIEIMKLWGKVCKERGWKASDKPLRLAKFSEFLGRPIASANDIGRIDECTKAMNELRSLLGVSLQAGLEANDQTINRERTTRHHILTELVPCLEVYLEDVAGYITSIMEDKNRWWKIDRPVRDITLMDLDAKPVFRHDKKSGELKEFPSQLEQMKWTLAARLNTLRNEAKDTIHEMKMKAGVPCGCATHCRPKPTIVLANFPKAEQEQLLEKREEEPF